MSLALVNYNSPLALVGVILRDRVTLLTVSSKSYIMCYKLHADHVIKTKPHYWELLTSRGIVTQNRVDF